MFLKNTSLFVNISSQFCSVWLLPFNRQNIQKYSVLIGVWVLMKCKICGVNWLQWHYKDYDWFLPHPLCGSIKMN